MVEMGRKDRIGSEKGNKVRLENSKISDCDLS